MGLSRVVSLACAVLATLACGGADRPGGPNVLLVTFDTTRADHLGVYGHRRDTSPNLDALAAEAVVFANAHSTSTWTLPSHASLFTGKLPSSHGARYDPEGPLVLGDAIGAGAGIRARGLAPGETTLAKRLGDAGYATAGFAGGPWLLRDFGLSAGFAHWDDDGILGPNGRPADALCAAAVAWLGARLAEHPDTPFFAFVNFFDPHFPFEAPTRFVREFLPPGVQENKLSRSQFDALYDAEIRFADEQLGVLLDFLRERGVYRDTLVVVTADHGEMIGEHGEWGHNGIPYEPVVRIPLVVKAPGSPQPRTEERPIQLTQVFDLVLELAGLSVPAAGEPPPRIAEVWHPPAPGVGTWKVLWQDGMKFMQHGDGDDRLYDLEADPRERVNRLAERPEQAQRMREQFAAVIAALPAPPGAPETPRAIDDETREALHRLGYLGEDRDPQ